MISHTYGSMAQIGNRRVSPRFILVGLIVAIRVLLDLNYIYLISPKLGYAGLELDLNTTKLLWSYVLLLAVAVLIQKRYASPSSFGILMLTTFIVVPVTSYWAMKDEANGLVYIVVGSILLVRLIVAGGEVRIPGLKDGQRFFLALAALVIVAFFVPLLVKGGLAHMSFSLEGAYDRREYFHSNLTSEFSGYFMSWFAKIINPTLMAYFAIKRRFFVVALLFGLQLVGYSMTTMKAQVLFPLFVFFVFYLHGRWGDVRIWFLLAVAAIAALCLLAGSVNEISIFVALLSRAFYSVAQNHFDYYSFFQKHEFVYWANSAFNPFASFSYDRPIAAIIGYGRYQVGEDAFANTGYIASGYSHMGIAGVLVYSVLLGLILKLFDGLAGNVPKALGLSVSGLAILQLVNSDLTTAMLSHGVILAMLVLFLLGSKVAWSGRRREFLYCYPVGSLRRGAIPFRSCGGGHRPGTSEVI